MAIDHPSDALPPGYRLKNYEILRVLGRGGFGLTYQARRSGTAGDMVAIKELYPHATAMRGSGYAVVAKPGTHPGEVAAAVEMFLREARLICALDHPHIVRGVESFSANGTGYLVMRYVSGKNLRESLRDPRGFQANAGSVLLLFGRLLDGLATLHRQGLLHCDIKPDNIFLGPGFEPILIDLGSARRHEEGVGGEDALTYSVYFSAIEQTTDRFGPIGPWTDIYQLSAVLYRCVTGGKVDDAVDRVQERSDPYMPLAEMREVVEEYPRALIEAIDRGLGLYPGERPQSVEEWRRPLVSMLPRVVAGGGVKSRVAVAVDAEGTPWAKPTDAREEESAGLPGAGPGSGGGEDEWPWYVRGLVGVLVVIAGKVLYGVLAN